HTDEYFIQRSREAAKLDVERICFKDPGGLLTPESTRRLVPLIQREANGKPVEFHTHCNTGLGALCCLEAIQLGITSINTAIPPLAEGSSNPSLFNVAMNGRALGYQTMVDEEMVKPVRDHFMRVAKQENLPIGRPLAYDALHPLHQVPGGMISNFRFQLANLAKLDQLPAVLEEVTRVRAEFGYPIMVTPYSQFFGVQAAINVMVGARYQEVTDEVLLYALGYWGEEEAESINANLRDRLVNSARAKELAKVKAPDIGLAEFRMKFGGDGVSDDDKLLNFFAGAEALAALKAAGAPKDYARTATPLVALIEQLSRRQDPKQVYIKREGFSLRMARRRPAD
ncbi:MAG: biotin carboxyl carrier protein, partial [Candidatus Binatia bacterium]